MKISVITPTFNSSKTIARTIESLLSQSHFELEHVIVDNSSSDDTIKIIEQYRKKYDENKMSLVIISEKDNGLYDAINKGIKKSSGDFIGILSSNDYYFSNTSLEKIHDNLIKSNSDSVYGNLIFKNETKVSRVWKSKVFFTGDFYKSWTPAHPTFYYKRKLHEKHGYYRVDYKIASDVDFMFKLLEISKISSKYIDENLIIMSDGGISNKGLRSKIIITNEMFNTFKENKIKASKIKYLYYKVLKIKEMRI
jgi:glycosyltransferase involved in cell wall biosynthesis